MRAIWTDLRYGYWQAVRGRQLWYARRYWLGFPLGDWEGPMSKREAEGVAALNNDCRGLPLD